MTDGGPRSASQTQAARDSGKFRSGKWPHAWPQHTPGSAGRCRVTQLSQQPPSRPLSGTGSTGTQGTVTETCTAGVSLHSRAEWQVIAAHAAGACSDEVGAFRALESTAQVAAVLSVPRPASDKPIQPGSRADSRSQSSVHETHCGHCHLGSHHGGDKSRWRQTGQHSPSPAWSPRGVQGLGGEPGRASCVRPGLGNRRHAVPSL